MDFFQYMGMQNRVDVLRAIHAVGLCKRIERLDEVNWCESAKFGFVGHVVRNKKAPARRPRQTHRTWVGGDGCSCSHPAGQHATGLRRQRSAQCAVRRLLENNLLVKRNLPVRVGRPVVHHLARAANCCSCSRLAFEMPNEV